MKEKKGVCDPRKVGDGTSSPGTVVIVVAHVLSINCENKNTSSATEDVIVQIYRCIQLQLP
jgi:hypothetical protein